MSDNYEVGFGKPPRQHQFKPGNQAARKRRKANSDLSIPEILVDVLKRKRRMQRGGNSIEMSVAEIVAERLVLMATQGSPRELRTFIELLERYVPQHLSGPPEKLEIVYRRAENSKVELPSASMWDEGDS